jgi:hypothetical protein
LAIVTILLPYGLVYLGLTAVAGIGETASLFNTVRRRIGKGR